MAGEIPPPRSLGPLGPIQVVPLGVAGLLQLKQLGRLPDKLAETVAPVLELRDWYLSSRVQNETSLFGQIPPLAASPGFAAQGFFPFQGAAGVAAVPPGQVWWVEDMTVKVINHGAMVATDLVRFRGCVVGANNQLIRVVTDDVLDTALAARTRTLFAKCTRGFWAYSGEQFGIFVEDTVTTNGYDAQLGLRATPCPI